MLPSHRRNGARRERLVVDVIFKRQGSNLPPAHAPSSALHGLFGHQAVAVRPGLGCRARRPTKCSVCNSDNDTETLSLTDRQTDVVPSNTRPPSSQSIKRRDYGIYLRLSCQRDPRRARARVCWRTIDGAPPFNIRRVLGIDRQGDFPDARGCNPKNPARSHPPTIGPGGGAARDPCQPAMNFERAGDKLQLRSIRSLSRFTLPRLYSYAFDITELT